MAKRITALTIAIVIGLLNSPGTFAGEGSAEISLESYINMPSGGGLLKWEDHTNRPADKEGQRWISEARNTYACSADFSGSFESATRLSAFQREVRRKAKALGADKVEIRGTEYFLDDLYVDLVFSKGGKTLDKVMTLEVIKKSEDSKSAPVALRGKRPKTNCSVNTNQMMMNLRHDGLTVKQIDDVILGPRPASATLIDSGNGNPFENESTFVSGGAGA